MQPRLGGRARFGVRPIYVELAEPRKKSDGSKGPSAPDWTDAVKQLREVAKWIVGAIVAAAAGIATGSSLTNIGKLDWTHDRWRITAALAGLGLAYAAIGAIFTSGVNVIAPSAGNLRLLVKAGRWTIFGQARRALYKFNTIDESQFPLGKLLDAPESNAGKVYLPALYATGAFAIVRAKFTRMLLVIAVSLPLLIGGLIVFVWAANPPEREKPAEKGIILKIAG